GALTIWSSTTGTGLEKYFGRQILYLGLALIAFLVVLSFDYHIYSDYISFLYLGGMGVLVAVLFLGRTHHSTKVWLGVRDSVAFQPSELVKVLAIIALAKYYSESERDYLEISELIVGALIVGAPMLLVILQGDLGTAVTFPPILLAVSFMAGLRRKYVI